MHCTPLRSLSLVALLVCAPALAAADCKYTPIGSFDLLTLGGQTRTIVDGSINGKPARFGIGSGSSGTRLSKDAAARLGLPLQQLRGHALGIGGASTAYAVKVDDFAVGDIHSGKTLMPVLGNIPGGGLDATLGADFLMQADLEISMAEKKIRFFRPTGCKDTYLAYWSTDAVELPFGGTYTRHANPRFMVEVNGARLEASISTSSAYTTLSRTGASRAGIKLDGEAVRPSGTVTGVGEDAVATWQVEADRVSLGSETIEHAHLTVLDTPPQGSMIGFPDLMLGRDFLMSHRVLIANDQRKVYFSYLGGEVFKPRKLAAAP